MRTSKKIGKLSCGTVSLSQLIQRGFTMLVKVIAHAIDLQSAIAHIMRQNTTSEEHTNDEDHQRPDVDTLAGHCV